MVEKMMCGIEIHQQLDTKKLFCRCPSSLNEEEGEVLQRRLRPTQSELGEIDRAALVQAEKRMHFRYQAPKGVSCLVDEDEEPPHDCDAEAMDITLMAANLLNAKVVDEVHFMRKIVIDGSNTTGFQRTALVAVDGWIEVNGRKISILSICLEEDAARKVETKGSEITYRLDRLGIPLIEIATGPDMRTPEEVKEVAASIGSLLRATRRVKRGIGTIREDVNISIPGGARVEVKGVQELRMLPAFVQKEIDRQASLLVIKQVLEERAVEPLIGSVVDVSGPLQDSKSKVISGALAKGGRVLAVALPGFAGVLKSQDGKLRLGAEMAQYARTKGVMGIFHSDELPAYGITQESVNALRTVLELKEGDAFALCVDEGSRAESALKVAVERANQALKGVPEETRDPLPDGSTAYSRPLPGASRMYPETDVRPIIVTEGILASIQANLPEMPEEMVARFVSKYGVHEQLARQLVKEGHEVLFEELAVLGMAAEAARTFLNTYAELENEGIDIGKLEESKVKEAFLALKEDAFAKEALPAILKKLLEGRQVRQAIDELGLKKVDSSEAQSVIASIVLEKEAFVREKGLGAIGPLMAPVMERLRGKLDGKMANQLLKQEIEKLLAKQ